MSSDPHKLNWLGATEIARRIADGRVSSEAVVQSCLERIAERETDVGAWVHLDPEKAISEARSRDARGVLGPLHGVPVGVKDIIETFDMPTAYGSPIYAGHMAPIDAACVAAIRRAGAVVLGKTLSTEFAFFPPGKTANPANLEHTPGGSSSGSAAAVADGMAAVAFGTQTAGSVVRPAAYCGVVGYKMSYGCFSMAGIRPFAQSLDTLGTFARCVGDADLIRSVLLGAPRAEDRGDPPPAIAVFLATKYDRVEDATANAIERVARAAAACGARIIEFELPQIFDGLLSAQESIMSYEAAQNFIHERIHHADQLHPDFRKFLDQCDDVSFDTYSTAVDLVLRCRHAIQDCFSNFDMILTPSTHGEAPLGLKWTGSPVFCRIWTMLHLPVVSLPAGIGPHGLPVGVQLVGKFGRDTELLSSAKWLEAVIDAESSEKNG